MEICDLDIIQTPHTKHSYVTQSDSVSSRDAITSCYGISNFKRITWSFIYLKIIYGRCKQSKRVDSLIQQSQSIYFFQYILKCSLCLFSLKVEVT